MARYDYVCPSCETVAVDVFHLIRECDTHVEVCPECGDVMRRRNDFAAVGVVAAPLGVRSHNPNIERFLETGDPKGLRRSDPEHIR